MKTHQIPSMFLVLAVLLAMVACVGGGSGGTGYSGGGVGGSGIISRGAIEEIGSLMVNGTDFDTTNAAVVINGETVGTGDAVIEDRLSEGKVVTVQGAPGEDEEYAVAQKVIYRNDVEGPVSLVDDSDPDTLALTVMGQTVMVNYLTHLKHVDLEGIAPNMVVEISGFCDDEGTIWATFLEAKGPYQEDTVYEVKGFVADHDELRETFEINGLVVSYVSADTSGLPGGVPENGLLVEASGTVDDDFVLMTAGAVDLEDDLEADNAEEIEITGFVTAKTSTEVFTVGNQTVLVAEGAEFVDGVQDDIAPGKKLEAEGELVDGILVAWEIEFWEPDQFEIEGAVIGFVSEWEFTVDGQVVNTTPETVYEDGDSSDLDNGVDVEIKGRMQGNVMIADKVSFELEDT